MDTFNYQVTTAISLPNTTDEFMLYLKTGTLIDVLITLLTPLVEVTRTDPLEKLVWANRKDSDDERNKILN